MDSSLITKSNKGWRYGLTGLGPFYDFSVKGERYSVACLFTSETNKRQTLSPTLP